MYDSNKKVMVIIVIALIILVAISFSLISNGKVLVVENLDTGDKIENQLLDDSFVLGYTHSVLLTPAEEYFSVKEDNGLLLRRTVYESFGVGFPYEQEHDSDFEIKDDKFILYLNREMREINMVISSIPDHWIGIGESRFELVDIIEERGSRIKIYVEDRKILKFGKHFTIIF